jgi:hypothetical protein
LSGTENWEISKGGFGFLLKFWWTLRKYREVDEILRKIKENCGWSGGDGGSDVHSKISQVNVLESKEKWCYRVDISSTCKELKMTGNSSMRIFPENEFDHSWPLRV